MSAEPALVLDCLGQRCPLPVIRLARQITQVPVGAVVAVLADDPAAGNDLAAWCRLTGQQWVQAASAERFEVRRLH